MSGLDGVTRALVRVGSTLAVASLALAVDNLRRVRTPSLADGAVAEPLCVLLPVRDEARHVAGCVAALTAALDDYPGPALLHVLDDGSTDGTTALVRRLAAEDERVTLREGAPPPAGWLGKPWACHQLAEAALALPEPPGALVFVDADVTVAPHALTASVGLLRRAGLDLVCPYPHQQAEGAVERLVQPLLVWSWMSTLPLGLAETSPRPSLAAANGQLLVADTAAYRRAGGHAAVRGEVVEDVALLRAFKRAGARGVVADGSGVATCRMYRGAAELRAGYRKSLWTAFGSPAGAAGVTALLVLVHVVPAGAALRGSRTGAVGYAASVLARVLVARRTGARVLPDALAHPVSVLALAALTTDSVVGRRRGALRWKGRDVTSDAEGPR